MRRKLIDRLNWLAAALDEDGLDALVQRASELAGDAAQPNVAAMAAAQAADWAVLGDAGIR